MLASPTSAQRRGEVAAAAAEHCTAAAVSQDACSRRHSLWLLG